MCAITRMKRRFPRMGRKGRGILLGVVCGLVCWGINDTEMVRWLEHWALDTLFVFRGTRGTSTKLMIIGIDDQSVCRLNKPIALISPELAKVVSFVQRRGAAAIGLDILVPESPRNRSTTCPDGPAMPMQWGWP